MLVHYIYINRNNKFDKTIPQKLRKLAEDYQAVCPEVEIMIHNYFDIYDLLYAKADPRVVLK